MFADGREQDLGHAPGELGQGEWKLQPDTERHDGARSADRADQQRRRFPDSLDGNRGELCSQAEWKMLANLLPGYLAQRKSEPRFHPANEHETSPSRQNRSGSMPG